MNQHWFKGGILILLFIAIVLINSSYQQRINAEEDRILQMREVEQKQYIADQKRDCLNIYETEGKKWDNVRGWSYNDLSDSCEIVYDDTKRKSESECEAMLADAKEVLGENPVTSNILIDYLHCMDGTFHKTF